MTKLPNYENIVAEVLVSLNEHYQTWIAQHPNDDVYAFVIYASPLVSAVSVSVLTEQGLQRIAMKYKTEYRYKATLAQLSLDLRWSVADTPYCADSQNVFDAINQRLGAMMSYVDSLETEDPAFNKHIVRMYGILVDALNQFRTSTLADANRPLLYVDFGDMSDEERFWFIQQCNDADQAKWYTEMLGIAR